MISVEEAKKFVFEQEVMQTAELRRVADCLGYVLSEDVYAPLSMPPFPQSAMDGYAVKGNHSTYTLIGETKAGDSDALLLEDGEARRVFTGSAVPENATTVIMQEKVQRNGNTITIDDEPTEGKNIRPIGEQLTKGELILEKGMELTPAGLGMLHTLGLQRVAVWAKPSVHLILTGNELVEAGEALQYGQIYESNAVTLSSALQKNDIKCMHTAIADDYEQTVDTLREKLEKSDVLLISGGISVGDYDFVGKALKEIGVKEIFYKVRQKPGKPLFFGRKGNKFVFALPGNPAAALTCLFMYALPLMRKISGMSDIEAMHKDLTLKEGYEKKGQRAEFLKALAKDGEVEILGKQASSMLWSFAHANALVYIPEEKSTILAGEKVRTYIV